MIGKSRPYAVETTSKLEGETFRAEPLMSEESWRVRRSRDGQNVMFRVSRETAEAFAAAMNEAAPTPSHRLDQSGEIPF